MGSVSRTELNQQTARVLARVAAGERLTITDRGRPVAQIGPPSASQWGELVAAGIITPRAARGPLPFDAVESDESTADILADLRADRA
jgi:prevent-host-death family protein